MNFTTTVVPFHFRPGTRPLLISMPHSGTHLPAALAARLSDEALGLADTDWHLQRLYDFADALGASLLVATHSRYVIDLNRPPDGSSLYPGQSVTALCPIDSFDNAPIYRSTADQPDPAEIAARCDTIWRPYHAKLEAELARIKSSFGVAALWDAHSIRSVLPRFFDGRLPDLNLGTADGASCDVDLAQRLLTIAHQAQPYSAVLNGRFKGGYITRHYGRPAQGIHAVQLEMTQASYMLEQPPYAYCTQRAAAVQPHLRRMLEAVLEFVESR